VRNWYLALIYEGLQHGKMLGRELALLSVFALRAEPKAELAFFAVG